MAETVVENLVCDACGVGVREDSEFCYNCGESISKEFYDSGRDENDTSNDVRLVDQEIPETSNEDDNAVTANEVGIVSPKENTDDVFFENSVTDARTRLETAASLRNKSKAFNKKPIEVIWEEPAKPSKLFVFVSIVLTLFAAAMLFLALYLK